MAISNGMTTIGLTNGMIGGIILVMPLLALRTGWLLILPITLFTGFVSYFACLLCLRHLRNYKNLDVAIYHHFGKKVQYKIFYDIIIIVSMTTLLILYFSLICQQWAGIIGQSKVISILNALILFPIVYVMKKYDFGATLLAYGIISIIGYVLFLIWLFLSTDQGPKKVPATHQDFVDLAAALAQGFAIQTFFIPILKKNPNQKLYKKLLGFTYIIGTLIYTFIGYTGAYSLVNRTSFKTPQTIQDYFGSGSNWEVILVEIIYLIHLYSAFPEFLLIAKQRFFSVFKWPQPKEVSIKQVIYVAVTIFLSLIVKLTNISVTVIIELNGSIISFFFIYVIPIGLHLKCVYFTKPEDRHSMLNEQKERQNQDFDKNSTTKPQEDGKYVKSVDSGDERKQKGDIQMQESPIQAHIQIKQTNQNKNVKNSQDEQTKNQQNINEQVQMCECDIKFKSKLHQYAQLSFLAVMLVTGLLIMGYTLYLLIFQEKET